MAKLALINREEKRRKLVAQYRKEACRTGRDHQ